MSNIKKNLGYQTFYQLLNTCIPLITAPYLSRVLGAENLGIFSYTQSVVGYFTLFAMLGLANYGTRTIASVMNDKEKVSKEFLSIFSLQFITSTIAIGGYIFYFILFCKDNRIIALVQILAIISCYLDINWLFFGLEKFEITVKINIIIRIFTLVSVLVFVKTTEDLWIYTFIMVFSTLLSQFVLWIYVPQYISIVKFNKGDVIKHIKPNLVLFIPIAAMSVYHIMDKTMLGAISSFEETGYYYNSDKIINIPAGILSGISTVLMPRVTALISENKHEEMISLFKKSLEGTIFISSALTFGIAAISNEFIPVFFGKGYDECILLTVVLSPILIIKGFSFTFRYQYLIPYKMDKKYIYSILCGMIVNLFVNIILIPIYGAMGAVIGTLIAELTACVIQSICVFKQVNIIKSCLKCMESIFMGIVMYISVRCVIDALNTNDFVKIGVGILTGIVVYLGIAFVLLIIGKKRGVKNEKKTTKCI